MERIYKRHTMIQHYPYLQCHEDRKVILCSILNPSDQFRIQERSGKGYYSAITSQLFHVARSPQGSRVRIFS